MVEEKYMLVYVKIEYVRREVRMLMGMRVRVYVVMGVKQKVVFVVG